MDELKNKERDTYSEEMEEFIADPEIKTESVELKETTCNCTVHLNEDSATPKVQVEPLGVTGSHLMTKRMTIAGGFLDIALFTNNCEQLKFVLELGEFHIYYNEVVALLITSLVLQLLIGLTMFLLGCHVTQKASDEAYSNFLNHTTMGLVALITIINIFIGTFGPKGTVMARCLGAFAYPNTYSPVWQDYLNATQYGTVWQDYLNATQYATNLIWQGYLNATWHYMASV